MLPDICGAGLQPMSSIPWGSSANTTPLHLIPFMASALGHFSPHAASVSRHRRRTPIIETGGWNNSAKGTTAALSCERKNPQTNPTSEWWINIISSLMFMLAGPWRQNVRRKLFDLLHHLTRRFINTQQLTWDFFKESYHTNSLILNTGAFNQVWLVY